MKTTAIFDTVSILHVDMDAFYASVEQRDQPELCVHPVIPLGDVVAASLPTTLVTGSNHDRAQHDRKIGTAKGIHDGATHPGLVDDQQRTMEGRSLEWLCSVH
jgi:hypothetical protein